MNLIIVYGLVFASVLLFVDIAVRALMVSQRGTREVNERLKRISQGSDQDTVYGSLLKDRGFGQDRGPALQWLWKLYQQSGLHIPPAKRAMYLLVIFMASWVLSLFFVRGTTLQMISTVFLTGALTVMILMRLRSRRINIFVNQIPVAVDVLTRSLHAGHPLNAAISLVSREMPDPIGSEFGILSDQLAFGAEIDDGMMSMVERVGAEELNLLAVSMSVQRGTGGNLAEVLENLSQMVRGRTMMRAKIRAISAEGRITAVVMGIFPFLLYLMVKTMVPTYFDSVWATGYGTYIVVGVLVWMGIGALILRNLVKFDF